MTAGGQTTGTGLATQSGPLDVDAADNLLGLLLYTSSTGGPTALNVYDISDPNNISLLASRAFPTANVDGNGVGSVAFGPNGVVYALGTNNGIVAYKLVATPEPTALALFAAGAAGLLARRRARR